MEGAALASEQPDWRGPGRQAEDKTSQEPKDKLKIQEQETQGQPWGESRALAWALPHVQTHAIANALPHDNFQLHHLFHRHL